LYIASEEGYFDIVKLLKKAGARIAVKNEKGETPLSLAEKNSKTDIVVFLKKSLFSIALKEGNVGSIRNLLEKGVNVNEELEDGNMPLLVFVSECNNKTFFNCLKLLTDKGADVNIKNNEGLTPLHYLTSCPLSGEIVVKSAELLVSKGADVNCKNSKGQTPLHLLAVGLPVFCVPFAHLLLSHGANPNEKDNDSLAPLHVAARNKETPLAFMKELLGNDSDPNITDGENLTPLDGCCCCAEGKELLKSSGGKTGHGPLYNAGKFVAKISAKILLAPMLSFAGEKVDF